MQGMITSAASATSSLYGNVGCAVRELILSHFPYEFFTYVNVSSEMPYRNIRRVFGGSNSQREIKKRRKPYMVIRPTYQVPDQDTFLQGVPLTKNIDHMQYNSAVGYLFPVLADTENQYSLKFKLNRDHIEFDVTITLSTLHQQIDLYKAMVNQMCWDRTFAYDAALESIIPKSIIAYMAQMSRIDIYKHPELIPVFIQHLNSISGYPITYKIRNSSAIEEFFMYYKHNLMIAFYDLSIDEPTKKNMIDDNFNINFKVSVDFNLPGLFNLFGSDYAKRSLDVTLMWPEKPGSDEAPMEYIPIYTMTSLFDKYPMRKDAFTLFASTIFHLTPDKSNSDSVNISSLFDQERRYVLKAHSQFNIPLETIIDIIVVKDNIELKPESDYSIDWINLTVNIYNIDKDSTYRAVIYTNNDIINDTIVSLVDEYQTDKSGLKENNPPEVKEQFINSPPAEIIPGTKDDPYAMVSDDKTPMYLGNFVTMDSPDDPIPPDTIGVYEGDEIEVNIPEIELQIDHLDDDSNYVMHSTIDDSKLYQSKSIETWSSVLGSANLYNYIHGVNIDDKNYTKGG